MKDKVVQESSKILRERAKTIAKKDIGSRTTQGLIVRMKKILASEEFGVAIAAPQVGESLRLFVVAGKVFSKPKHDRENGLVEAKPTREPFRDHVSESDMVFINPQIVRLSKKKREMTEGCLSVRNKYGTVMRNEKASIKALDENGKEFTYHGSDLIAHIFQHECDHLDGILYTDKAIKLEDDKDWKELNEKRKEK